MPSFLIKAVISILKQLKFPSFLKHMLVVAVKAVNAVIKAFSSDPGLLFVGRFLITVSISMLVMGLLRFSYFFLAPFWKVVLF